MLSTFFQFRKVAYVRGLFLILISFPQFGIAQNYVKLANRLTKDDSTDLEKVESISNWITENIKYDAKAYKKLKFKGYTPQQTLKRKKALCGEYAKLNKAMLTSVGVSSLAISGYDRFFYYYPNEPLYMNMHAWNMVKIDSIWHHSDLTWASGGLKSKKQHFRKFLNTTFGIPYLNDKLRFVRQHKQEYVLTNSALFDIRNHLPSNPIFQINKKQLTTQEFIDDSIYVRTSNCTDRYDIDKYVNYSEDFQRFISGKLAYEYNRKNNRIKAQSEYYSFKDNLPPYKIFKTNLYTKDVLLTKKTILKSSNKYFKLHIGDLKKMYAKRKRDNNEYHNATTKDIKNIKTTVSNELKNNEKMSKSVLVQFVKNQKSNIKLQGVYRDIIRTLNPKFKSQMDTVIKDSLLREVRNIENEIDTINSNLVNQADSSFNYIYMKRNYLLKQKQIISYVTNSINSETPKDTLHIILNQLNDDLKSYKNEFNTTIKSMNNLHNSKNKLLSELKKYSLEHDKYNKGTYLTQMNIKIDINHLNIDQNLRYNNWAKNISHELKANNKLLTKMEKRIEKVSKSENFRFKAISSKNSFWLDSFTNFAEKAIKNNDSYIELIDIKLKQK